MQESSNKIIQDGEIVSFDTDMVGPYGYCADISRAFVCGNKFNEYQKKLYQTAVEQIDYNSRLIKAGLTFKEFTEKAWIISFTSFLFIHMFDITYFDGRISLLCWTLLAGLRSMTKKEIQSHNSL